MVDRLRECFMRDADVVDGLSFSRSEWPSSCVEVLLTQFQNWLDGASASNCGQLT